MITSSVALHLRTSTVAVSGRPVILVWRSQPDRSSARNVSADCWSPLLQTFFSLPPLVMEEEESVEFKTVKTCAGALAKALKGAGPETAMVNFLKEEGFINEGVHLNVIDTKSPLSVADKTNLLVEGIKNRIDQDEDSYKLLVDKFKKSGVMYEPIVKKLTKEYEKQYAAANPNTPCECACMCMYRKQVATCNVRIYSSSYNLRWQWWWQWWWW